MEPTTAVRLRAALWAATIAGVVAMVAAIALAVMHRRHEPRVASHSAERSTPPLVDVRVQAPSEWATLPIVARTDEARATSTWDERTETRRWQIPIGDLFATFDERPCPWGGSACAGSPPNCGALRVGDLDDDGRPALASGILEESGGSCVRDFELRRSADGSVYVVSLRTPAHDDRVVAAFTRARVTPAVRALVAPGPSHALAGGALAALFASLGLAALYAAIAHVRRGGLLAWREARLEGGAIALDGARVVVAGADVDTARTVLVDPRALERGADTLPYRELASVERRFVRFASHAESFAYARLAVAIVAVSFFASALATWLGFATG